LRKALFDVPPPSPSQPTGAQNPTPNPAPTPLTHLTTTLSKTRTAPCYLILCTPAHATVLEKDLTTAKIRTSDEFLVHTNHDIQSPDQETQSSHNQKEKSMVLGMEALVEESEERREHVVRKWEGARRRWERKRGKKRGSLDTVKEVQVERAKVEIREETLKGWVKGYPVTNECTHFGCIMDPSSGTIRWIERGVLEADEQDPEE
jgi:hypothetical protein